LTQLLSTASPTGLAELALALMEHMLAAMILITEALITDVPEKEKAPAYATRGG